MFRYAVLIDIGVHEDQNDDRVSVDGNIVEEGWLLGTADKDYFLAAVCDGAGGVKQGGRAAGMAVNGISECLAPGLSAADIRAAIERVNSRVVETGEAEGARKELMTTVAGIYANGENLIVFNAGDSRVYRLRGQYLRLLSKDHSYVQDLVDIGKITPEEAHLHPKKNIINKFIGIEQPVNPRVKEFTEDLLNGDIFMICSDGITDVLTDAEICEIMRSHSRDIKLDRCCSALRDAAVKAGSLDNITVLLIRKEGTEE